MYNVRVAYASQDKELTWGEFKTTDRMKAQRTYKKFRETALRLQVLKDGRLLFEKAGPEVIELADAEAFRRFMA